MQASTSSIEREQVVLPLAVDRVQQQVALEARARLLAEALDAAQVVVAHGVDEQRLELGAVDGLPVDAEAGEGQELDMLRPLRVGEQRRQRGQRLEHVSHGGESHDQDALAQGHGPAVDVDLKTVDPRMCICSRQL